MWFAFKLYLWRIEKQRRHQLFVSPDSCDLLSNCIFDVLKNNICNFIYLPHKVVICFQIVSLTYWKTTCKAKYYEAVSCDLLSNCIFDVLKNNWRTETSATPLVVICFQIVSLTYWKTTRPQIRFVGALLWFAFKLYLWRIEKQPVKHLYNLANSCDLLSNCIFDVLKNNASWRIAVCLTVVICFQIVSLTYWKTTSVTSYTCLIRLWFAFKLYLWRIEKQPVLLGCSLACSCDLLSNCIFDVLKNNASCSAYPALKVVICFQIVSLTYWKTTPTKCIGGIRLLWFAFKLYLWRIEKQLYKSIMWTDCCCDLLSNCIFDVLKNNRGVIYLLSKTVVICFQIVSLTYWKTTNPLLVGGRFVLWFAFKLYLWRIEKQLSPRTFKSSIGCDLLSNCIFDVLKNNCQAGRCSTCLVVICFQIVSLTYWKTTYSMELPNER